MLAQVDDVLNQVKKDSNFVLYMAAGVGALFVVMMLLRIRRGLKKPADLQRGQREDMASYPPPPPATGPKRLTINGLGVRLRLVVLAPAGTQQTITADDAVEKLHKIVKGLGDLIKADKPRVKIWPTQLSLPGFAPTFHRLVQVPTNEWIKVAGVARVYGQPLLVGLVFWAEEPNDTGELKLDHTEWAETLIFAKG